MGDTARLGEIAARLLRSRTFEGSARSRELLAYLVASQVAGTELTPYSIAFDIFERDEAFDPSIDPIVRVQLSRVRALLKEYFETEGADEPVTLHLPMRQYKLQLTQRADQTAPVGGRKRYRTVGLVGIGLAVISVAGVMLWNLFGSSDLNKDFPIVAVMPIESSTYQANPEYLGTGLQQQIVTDLWRFRSIRPAIVNSDADVLELGADYVIRGSVSVTQAQILVSMQVRAVEDQQVIWRENSARIFDESVYRDLITDLSLHVARAVGTPSGVLVKDMRAKIGSEIGIGGSSSRAVYFCLLKFSDFRRFGSFEGGVDVAKCLENLLNSGYVTSEVLAASAWMHALSAGPSRQFIESPNEVLIDTALNRARKAVNLDQGSGFSHGILAVTNWVAGNEQLAILGLQQARALNPANPEDAASLGLFMCLAGRCNEGIDLAREALDTDPNPPPWYQTALIIDALVTDNPTRGVGPALSLVQGSDVNDCAYLVAVTMLADQPELSEQCRETIENNIQRNGDPLGGSRFWIRDENLIAILESSIKRFGMNL